MRRIVAYIRNDVGVNERNVVANIAFSGADTVAPIPLSREKAVSLQL